MASFTELLDSLPVLGVGASLSFGMAPDPVDLALRPHGPSFIEYAGAVQSALVAAPVAKLRAAGIPVLYHPSCLNLCGPWPNPRPWIEAVRDHVEAVDSAWLAQDVATCFVGEEPGYSIQLGYFVPPILTPASLDEATQRVEEVRSLLARPLLLEPAPVSFQLGDQSIFRWLSTLAERTDCGLLLDCGHVLSHLLAEERELDESLDELDTDRVVEIHVAGGTLQDGPATGDADPRRYYQDAHDLPILPETWRVLRTLLDRCPNLLAVCVECEGAVAQSVMPTLRKTRERVALGTCSERLRERVTAELEGTAPSIIGGGR